MSNKNTFPCVHMYVCLTHTHVIKSMGGGGSLMADMTMIVLIANPSNDEDNDDVKIITASYENN